VAASPQLLEYGVAGRALPGGDVSGDCSWVRQDRDSVHIAVIDGLGHGGPAAEAAAAAVTALEASRERSVAGLMMDCQAALDGTRGAVIGLAALDARHETMDWLGVGNIESRLVRLTPDGARTVASMRSHGGIVGRRLPLLHPKTIGLQPGDLIALATDGIEAEFEFELRLDLSPQQAATRVLARCAKASDDALVLVGRWSGNHGRRE
jgi:hypothetical protein